MLIWDDKSEATVAQDGEVVFAGHIASRAQADRWHALGYDIPAAAGRYRDMIAAWDMTASEDAADQLMREFYASEAYLAVQSGVAMADPDYWRFASAPKHHEWA